MSYLKNISLIVMIAGYAIAGINHFCSPASYIRITPHYIPVPAIVNNLAGMFEIFFAVLLIFPKSRVLAAWGIILMLIAFLPVHIQMVADAPLKLGDLVVSPLLAWIRLVVLQPLLILWAWWYTREEKAPL